MRVVSLACSNTEIICALGCASMLVGVDAHSDYPEDVVRSLPRVGPDLNIDVERVKALRPDLVIASLTVPGHERIVSRLQQAGLRFIAPEPVSLADVRRDMRLIADQLGVAERGETLVQEFDTAMRPDPTAGKHRPRILVEWWPKPVIVPGSRSWVSEMISLAGGVNPFAQLDVKSAPVSDEQVREACPEAVVISWCGVRTEKYHPRVVRRRPGWQELPALTGDRIAKIPEAYLGRPGPRLALGLRDLRAVIRSCKPA